MNTMSRLGEFNVSLYITNLERTISVLQKIDKQTDVIKNKFTPVELFDKKISDNIKGDYNFLLNHLKETFVIFEFGVNYLAIGLFQVWFKLDPFTEEPEFVFLNLNI